MLVIYKYIFPVLSSFSNNHRFIRVVWVFKVTRAVFELQPRFSTMMKCYIISANTHIFINKHDYNLNPCSILGGVVWQKFEKKYNNELVKGAVSKETKFEYAWCLIRSKYSEDIKKGIVLLEGEFTH